MTSFTDHIASAATSPDPDDGGPIPVTVVTGFLGAGKTTLLNRILRADHGMRVAVMVNDFGSIDIDGRLITGVESDVISLANGCICCSMQSSMVDEFDDLLRRADPLPDHVVIEASGVSDPAGIIRGLGYPRLRHRLRLDSVVALVDAERHGHLDGESDRLARRQLGLADIVAINKIDLVDAALVTRLAEQVRVPGVRIVETTDAAVPLELIGLSSSDTRRVGRPAAASVLANDADEREPHLLPVTTWTWRSEAPLDLQRLRSTLRRLPPSVYRAKGFVHLAEQPDRRVVAHLVGGRHELTVGAPWGSDEPRTELVLIGLGETLDPTTLDSVLAGCTQR